MKYEEFLKDTEYKILEPYVTALTKINHLHEPCGFVWNVRPNDIKNRFKKGITTGCPLDAAKLASLLKTNTRRDWLKQSSK